MNIVLVNLDFPPIGGPGVWRVSALAKYMALAGHQVTVVCSDRSSWHTRIDPSLLRDLPPGVRVHRIHSLFLKDVIDYFDRRATRTSSGLLKKIYAGIGWRLDKYWPNPVLFWALKSAIRTKALVKERDIDCIITSGPQHFSHLAGYLCRKRFDVKWVMDYRDPWTRPLKVSDTSYQFRLNSWLEQKFLSRADKVAVVSPTWLSDIAEGFGLDAGKFALKLNGHDIGAVPPLSRPKSIASRTVVHFNGMLAPGSADVFPVMLKSLAEVEQRGIFPETIKLSFCGIPDEFDSTADQTIAERYVENIGALSHADSIQQCLSSDALLVIVSDNRFYRGMIPGKLYEAVALGKHLLAVVGQNSDVRTLLDGYPYVTYADSADSQSIADAIVSMAETVASAGQLPVPNDDERQQWAEKFSRKQQASEYIDMIAKL